MLNRWPIVLLSELFADDSPQPLFIDDRRSASCDCSYRCSRGARVSCGSFFAEYMHDEYGNAYRLQSAESD